MNNFYNVLILDAEFPAALTILRSLSRHNIHCDLASSMNNPVSLHSRFANQFYGYPDPLVDTTAFIDCIYDLLQEHHYDLVIPVTERSLIPLSASPKLDPWRKFLAIADKQSLELVLDKAKTLRLATQCDIKVPFSHHVNNLSEIEAFASTLNYPVVLKPGQSIPDAKHRRQLSVSYAHNADELIHLSRSLLSHCQLLIQEYAQGIGTGVEILANQGDIVYAFQHVRIHEIPLTGGGSCLRKSITVDPVLLEASRRLISALNWHGVAMVEFKWQPETGQYWLMEINGRFWGSLPLAYAAGADFPKMLFDLLVLKQLPKTYHYKKEIYCRKLSADLYWLEQVLRHSDTSDLVRYPSKKTIFHDCLLAFHPTRHYFDIQCWYDPLPGIIDAIDIVKSQISRVNEILRNKLLLRWHSSSVVHNRLLKRAKKSNQILFICYGNINRSALAERMAEQFKQQTQVTFCSAGFHPQDNRPADPTMAQIAQENGIDLRNWQSCTLTSELIENADLILAMEIAHLERLDNVFPFAKNKRFLLGSISNKTNSFVEIYDPYNKDIEFYRLIYTKVQSNIENLLITLEATQTE